MDSSPLTQLSLCSTATTIDHYDGDPYDPAHEGMPALDTLSECQQRQLEGITDPDWVLAQYLGELTGLDDDIGGLLHLLQHLELEKNTLLIIAGVHGENHGEDGVWFEHGPTLNDAALSVPVWMQFPGVLPEEKLLSTRMETLTCLLTAWNHGGGPFERRWRPLICSSYLWCWSWEIHFAECTHWWSGMSIFLTKEKRLTDAEARQNEEADIKAAVDAMTDAFNQQKALKD